MTFDDMHDSLKKRYFYKLSTNALGLILGFFNQAIIPRGLGPKAYGDFNFLNSFFTFLVAFFDTGTSTCFYIKLSQRQREPKIVLFYVYFIGAVLLFMTVFMTVANLAGARDKLWPGQLTGYIYLAAFLAILVWATTLAIQMADAYGLTVSVEIKRMFLKIFSLALIALLFVNNKLNLLNFFIYNYVVSIALIALVLGIIIKRGYLLLESWKLKWAEVKSYALEFYNYSHPLFVSSSVGVVISMLDIWLLQVWGGSVQQGFFGLSNQISNICFFFTGAMTPLMMREFSVAHGDNDIKRMATLFRRNIPLLFSVTAFISCFAVVNADKLTIILGGGKFREAYMAVAIMSIYPIHRVYGQMTGSLFYATGQTKLFRNISLFFAVIGLPFTYILLAPARFFGLNMGAGGLAIKTVLICIIAVNVQLYFNSRFLGLSFWKYIAHQAASVGSFLFIAVLISFGLRYAMGKDVNIILGLLASGTAYTIVVGLFVYFYPRIFGLVKTDIDRLKGLLLRSPVIG